MKLDFLVVGSGLYGATFANRAKAAGYSCQVIDKREHIGGNAYTKNVAGVETHVYGAHIFHTANEAVWEYVNRFAAFNQYINSPIADFHGEHYNLPFNMNTFHQLWGVTTAEEAQAKLEEQRIEPAGGTAQNLEEKALQLVGPEIYNKLICGYTEKQWGRSCKDLPAFIIERLPLRYTYDNNYFNDAHQGIPLEGYTKMVERMLEGIPVTLHEDYFANKTHWDQSARCVVFTGPIDAFFDYSLGVLEYRALRFETEVLDMQDYQGNAVVNYTAAEVPYTRIIEHKHFVYGKQAQTVISKEYSINWQAGMEPYYPINNQQNNDLYQRYLEKTKVLPNIHFGGRLGEYAYLNMDQVIGRALAQSEPDKLLDLLRRGGNNNGG